MNVLEAEEAALVQHEWTLEQATATTAAAQAAVRRGEPEGGESMSGPGQ